MGDLLQNIDSELVKKAGEIAVQGAAALKLRDIISRYLGDRAAKFLTKGQSRLELDKARDKIQVDIEKTFLEKSLSTYTESEEGKEKLLAVGSALFYQQVKKFSNLEKVIETTGELLTQTEKEISSELTEDEWMNKFFNYAENVSTPALQLLWGRILAGKLTEPNSFSIRTIEFLKNISKYDAEIINDMARVCFIIDQIPFVPGNMGDYVDAQKTTLSYRDFNYLDELGILKAFPSQIRLPFVRSFSPTKQTYITIFYGRYVIYFDLIGIESELFEKYNDIWIPVIKVSFVGDQLRQLIDVKINIEHLRYFKSLIQQQLGGVNISCCYVENNEIVSAVKQRDYTHIISVRNSHADKETKVDLD